MCTHWLAFLLCAPSFWTLQWPWENSDGGQWEVSDAFQSRELGHSQCELHSACFPSCLFSHFIDLLPKGSGSQDPQCCLESAHFTLGTRQKHPSKGNILWSPDGDWLLGELFTQESRQWHLLLEEIRSTRVKFNAPIWSENGLDICMWIHICL